MDDVHFLSNRRFDDDRRSGADTRTDSEKQSIGERRSGADRRMDGGVVRPTVKPTEEQLATFIRRLKRALASERARDIFGVMRGEYEFSAYPDVLRTLGWLEGLSAGRVNDLGE